MSVTHVLFEAPSGYALFERLQCDEVGQELESVQASLIDLSKFGKMLRLLSFCPFQNVTEALDDSLEVAEGVMSKTLKAFLKLNLTALSKKKVLLGVQERNLAASIKVELGYECACSEHVLELGRAVRLHQSKVLAGMKDGDVERAQLGLAHAYTRSKLKYNINRNDNMIIQAIGIMDQLDKDLNKFAMRVREWYSWHFPELCKIVTDAAQYAKCVRIIGNRASMNKKTSKKLCVVLENDEARAEEVVAAANMSMGSDVSDVDMANIAQFAARVESLAAFRVQVQEYLSGKMKAVAPNTAVLMGDSVGARLIAHAGSLANLAKCPASTVQILGAEKALFRALKTKGNTPKYGLIYHSSFIGKAAQKNKGRISRFLANKCSIASRIDSYRDDTGADDSAASTTAHYGRALREQVEERLRYLECGAVPRKNADVMLGAAAAAAEESTSAATITMDMD